MTKPELFFVCGCNAAGKSSFIRTRISNLQDFEIIMTDVYKSRSKAIITQAINHGKNIILETVFNDASFKDIADQAKTAGYNTYLIVLFLDNPQHSLERVAFRSLEQNGLVISGNNIKINFNESFKNVATYFFYFDRSDFVYTGITGMNTTIMSFEKSTLVNYLSTDLKYPQKFAQFSFQHNRLNEAAYKIITANVSYEKNI